MVVYNGFVRMTYPLDDFPTGKVRLLSSGRDQMLLGEQREVEVDAGRFPTIPSRGFSSPHSSCSVKNRAGKMLSSK